MAEISVSRGPISAQKVLGLTEAQRAAYERIRELAGKIPPLHRFGRWNAGSPGMNRLLRNMAKSTGLPDPFAFLAYQGFGLRWE